MNHHTSHATALVYQNPFVQVVFDDKQCRKVVAIADIPDQTLLFVEHVCASRTDTEMMTNINCDPILFNNLFPRPQGLFWNEEMMQTQADQSLRHVLQQKFARNAFKMQDGFTIGPNICAFNSSCKFNASCLSMNLNPYEFSLYKPNVLIDTLKLFHYAIVYTRSDVKCGEELCLFYLFDEHAFEASEHHQAMAEYLNDIPKINKDCKQEATNYILMYQKTFTFELVCCWQILAQLGCYSSHHNHMITSRFIKNIKEYFDLEYNRPNLDQVLKIVNECVTKFALTIL